MARSYKRKTIVVKDRQIEKAIRRVERLGWEAWGVTIYNPHVTDRPRDAVIHCRRPR